MSEASKRPTAGRKPKRRKGSTSLAQRFLVAGLLFFTVNSLGFAWLWWMPGGWSEQQLNPHRANSGVVGIPHPSRHRDENEQRHDRLFQKILPKIRNATASKEERVSNGKAKRNSPHNEDSKGSKPSPPRQQSLLNCSLHGGPHDFASVDEMVYWKDIPSDRNHRFAFSRRPGEDERFLTFETDNSGFNNQRMVFEINLATAIATGRTMVLPRDRHVDHLEDSSGAINGRFGMDDFFDLPGIAQRLPDQLRVLPVDDFVRREGGPDKLDVPTNFTRFYQTASRYRWIQRDANGTYVVNATAARSVESYHDRFLLEHFTEVHCNVHKLGKANCSNYLDWIDGKNIRISQEYHAGYIRHILDEFLAGHPKNFNPGWGSAVVVLIVPNVTTDRTHPQEAANPLIPRVQSHSEGNTTANNNTTSSRNDTAAYGGTRFLRWAKSLNAGDYNIRMAMYKGKPVPVNADPADRLNEIFSSRRGLGVYDADLHTSKYYHQSDDINPTNRLLAHWYDYVFFEDWRDDLWMKRFVRDQLHYRDEFQCAAARIVAALRELAAKDGKTGGVFHTMHIRREDFGSFYKNYGVVKNASEIHDIVTTQRHIIPEDSVVYIATDERDKSWFEDFRRHYRAVYFLDDFVHLLGPTIPTEYYGMIDQLVASRGEHFVGTYYSTFTEYINRLRGYHSQKRKPHGTHTNRTRQEEREIRQQGKIPSWFYVPGKEDVYQTYTPIGKSVWEMEYALAWRNIDYDVDPDLRRAIEQDSKDAAAEALAAVLKKDTPFERDDDNSEEDDDAKKMAP